MIFVDGQPIVSTFSIVACDLEAGDWGVAVASKFLAAGAVVPWARIGAGSVATQAHANTAYGPDGLAAMQDGLNATEAVNRIIKDDPERDHRQVGLVDKNGNSAAFTGGSCLDWAGHKTGPCYSCQGNVLPGAATLDAMENSFFASTGDLSDRLIEALANGYAAGGDRRGLESAAVYVVRKNGGYGGYNDVVVDLRVDDAKAPIDELKRLMLIHHLYFGKSGPEEKLALDGEILKSIEQIMIQERYLNDHPDDIWQPEPLAVLKAFIGTENIEERVDLKARTIDKPAVDHLQRKFSL